MKSLGLTAVIAMLAITPTYAEECASGGGIIEVRSWSAEITGDSFAPLKIMTTLANIGDKAFRMVEAGTRFSDPLGRNIISIKVDPDLTLEPGQTADFEGFYMGGESERLASLPTTDVTAITCVRSILYETGEKVDF